MAFASDFTRTVRMNGDIKYRANLVSNADIAPPVAPFVPTFSRSVPKFHGVGPTKYQRPASSWTSYRAAVTGVFAPYGASASAGGGGTGGGTIISLSDIADITSNKGGIVIWRLKNNNTVITSSQTLTIDAGNRLQLSSGASLNNQGTIIINGSLRLNGSTTTFTNNGTVTNNGTLSVDPGTLANNNIINNYGTFSSNPDNEVSWVNISIINNSGTITNSGGTFTNNGTLNGNPVQ